ncbi:MAG: tRNA uridine-5-carboxymethylaminomethyl(34) synthesis GTPase MnmE, partial [Pseudomonadota bacterium]
MDRSSETIFALASGAPPSAIALVRLSGSRVTEIAEACLSRGTPPERRAVLDRLIDEDGETIDEGLAVFMPGPNSYTGEDTLEISLHGGRHIVDLALQRLAECGARLAEPGEFTRRAFEGGKMDLTQAEAVADLIDAESEAQHRLALTQLDGALSEVYARWRADLTDILALLDASVDFPDEGDAPATVAGPVLYKIGGLCASLAKALASGNHTERVRDGFQVVLLGPPNAGKSTLLNRLAGREAAIVTDIPGTTRDIVEVRTVLGPYLVRILDTAGLRETSDQIEQEGVRRARRASESADVRIWVIDGSGLGDLETLDIQDQDLVVLNKSDLGAPPVSVSRETLPISARSGQGVDDLLDALSVRLATLGAGASAPLLTRARHREAITEAAASLEAARHAIQSGLGAELVAEDVRAAALRLASLTGAVDVEDILGAVFSSF